MLLLCSLALVYSLHIAEHMMNLYKEIYNVEDAGVDPVREFNLYGKIAVMQLFRYKVLDHLPSGKI